MKKQKTESAASACFLIRVSKKPGEAWHGDVTWVTGQGEQKFESMQELFQLMNSTLDGTQLTISE